MSSLRLVEDYLNQGESHLRLHLRVSLHFNIQTLPQARLSEHGTRTWDSSDIADNPSGHRFPQNEFLSNISFAASQPTILAQPSQSYEDFTPSTPKSACQWAAKFLEKNTRSKEEEELSDFSTEAMNGARSLRRTRRGFLQGLLIAWKVKSNLQDYRSSGRACTCGALSL